MNLSESNAALWGWLTPLGLIALALLAANLLLHAVPFLKKSLMPTAVLGGFLLLALRCTNLIAIDRPLLEALAYHGIAVGFIALSLKVNNRGREKTGKNGGAALRLFKSGALIAGAYLLQGILGLGASLGLHATFRPGLFPAAGILLPMGYGQGPGQANNIGGIYESLGFTGGRSFGLSIAAAGYLSACVVGVIYLNVITKKGSTVPERKAAAGPSLKAPKKCPSRIR
ncbi:MAG: hypothetical protein LBP80_11080 [Treponema sp.]|nr:hypothetical protein [Treponema sp.]